MGHQAGDHFLRQVAERLQNVIGARGEIGRSGGRVPGLLPIEDAGSWANCRQGDPDRFSAYPIDDKRRSSGTHGIAVAPYDGVERPRSTRLGLASSRKNGGRGAFALFPDSRTRRRAPSCSRILPGHWPTSKWSCTPAGGAHGGSRGGGFEALLRVGAPRTRGVGPISSSPRRKLPTDHQLGEWRMRRACVTRAAWPERCAWRSTSRRAFTNNGSWTWSRCVGHLRPRSGGVARS